MLHNVKIRFGKNDQRQDQSEPVSIETTGQHQFEPVSIENTATTSNNKTIWFQRYIYVFKSIQSIFSVFGGIYAIYRLIVDYIPHEERMEVLVVRRS